MGDLSYEGALEIVRLAEFLFQEPYRRAEVAERRASYLLGASAIAGSLTLAGVSLLMDRSKISSGSDRLTLAVTLGASLVCLLAAAFRSLTAIKVLKWKTPSYHDLIPHSQRDLRRKTLLRAANLLHSGAKNAANAKWKIAMARRATVWFMRAVFMLVATALISLSIIVRSAL
jgi:hypothetical protein